METKKDLKNHIYEQFASICKAMGNSWRFELLDLLAQGEHSVEELAIETGMSIANTSQHLQQLRATHLVNVRRKGVEMKYFLSDERVNNLLQTIQELAEIHLAEMDRIDKQILMERQGWKIVEFPELQELLETNQVILLDVRPVIEFKAGHIPQAQSMPLNQIEDNFNMLPLTQPIVIYCRGYYSFLADTAVRFLLSHGFQAQRISLGFSEWKAQGHAVSCE